MYKRIIFGTVVGVVLQLLGYSYTDWQFYVATFVLAVTMEWAADSRITAETKAE